LHRRSIRATIDSARHKLDDASRLNYAKQYTIEYNVKVWFIGKISSDSEWQLRTDYNKVQPPLEIKGYRPPYMTGDAEDNADIYTYKEGRPLTPILTINNPWNLNIAVLIPARNI
jgi:hypothetical protein